jgi:hypothetical protein
MELDDRLGATPSPRNQGQVSPSIWVILGLIASRGDGMITEGHHSWCDKAAEAHGQVRPRLAASIAAR